jgi:hypothetical protein
LFPAEHPRSEPSLQQHNSNNKNLLVVLLLEAKSRWQNTFNNLNWIYLVKGIGIRFEKCLLDSRLLLSADLGVTTDMFLPTEAATALVTKERLVF